MECLDKQKLLRAKYSCLLKTKEVRKEKRLKRKKEDDELLKNADHLEYGAGMFSLQSDSRRTLIWRVPSTRYHQENTIERAGWLVWGGIILGSRTDLHVQNVTMTGHIYRDVILEQHVHLLQGAMGAEFLFMDDNARPHRANIVDQACPTRGPWAACGPFGEFLRPN
ncbi:transposable element Tcb1 transposase [Trichonephila clavipes]|nr:transposable element Tcb1 transposase [Trichonephila clavipes]